MHRCTWGGGPAVAHLRLFITWRLSTVSDMAMTCVAVVDGGFFGFFQSILQGDATYVYVCVTAMYVFV